jgi:hypothetical protein
VSIAEKIVDALLDEGWFSDRWADLKAATGIGHDSFGLGKNTEPGWTPSYGRRVAARSPEDEEKLRLKRLMVRKPQRTPGGENVWELD